MELQIAERLNYISLCSSVHWAMISFTYFTKSAVQSKHLVLKVKNLRGCHFQKTVCMVRFPF